MKPRVIVTRAKQVGVSDPLVATLKRVGLEPIHMPVVKQQSIVNHEPFPQPKDVNWLIFTSSKAVHDFKALTGLAYANVKSAVVGRKTYEAALKEGFLVEVVPEEEFTAEGLYHELRPHLSVGERVLFPKSRQSRAYLQQQLKKHRLDVHAISIYETVINDSVKSDLLQLKSNQPLYVVFTSPSAVNAYEQLTESSLTHDNTAFVLRPVTERHARNSGFKTIITAKEYTFDSLAKTIADFF